MGVCRKFYTKRSWKSMTARQRARLKLIKRIKKAEEKCENPNLLFIERLDNLLKFLQEEQKMEEKIDTKLNLCGTCAK